MKQQREFLKSSSIRKKLAEEDITIFARYYLSNHVQSEISELHAEWCAHMTTRQKIGLAAPRGHAKSTWFTLVYPLWCILFKKKKFIVLISDSATQAELLLGTIIEELETNELIIADFGRIAGYIPLTAEKKKKWTAKDIVTATDIKMIARGWNSRVRGIRYQAYRPDLVVLDDVENDENVQNEDQRMKVKDTFGKSILNLGDSKTQYMVIGTILHFDSLLMHIINNPGEGWYVKLYKAIKDDNTPLWPEWWTMEMFEALQNDPQVGRIRFQQEFMNNPLDPSQQIIKPQEFYEWYDQENCDHFAYMDLAISEKETADYTAIVTIGKHRTTGKLYIVEPVRIRGDVEEQIKLVFRMHRKYKYKKVGIEEVGYQKAFRQILNIEGRKTGLYIPAVGVEVDKDKVRRAVEITPFIDNGTVLFHNGYQDFMSEIIQFPKSAHDDFVDALSGAIKLIVGGMASGGIATGGRRSYPD